MRNITLLFIAAMLGSALGFAQKGTDRDTTQLEDIELRLGDAKRTADTTYIESITGPEWEEIGADASVISRAAFLDMLKSGALQMESLHVTNIRPRVYRRCRCRHGLVYRKGNI
jgi:hypothetical protein